MSNQTKTLSKTKLLKEINSIYLKCVRITEQRHNFDKYYDTIVRSERDHRRFRDWSCGLTVPQASKYFSIKYLLDSYDGYIPDPKNIMHIRIECFQGYALYYKNKAEFDELFSSEIVRDIIGQFDYAELM